MQRVHCHQDRNRRGYQGKVLSLLEALAAAASDRCLGNAMAERVALPISG